MKVVLDLYDVMKYSYFLNFQMIFFLKKTIFERTEGRRVVIEIINFVEQNNKY